MNGWSYCNQTKMVHEDYDYKRVLYIVLKRCLISSINNPGFQTLNVLLDKIMQNGGL